MSERSGGGVGSFIFGVALGAALGYLFAPAAGSESRRKLSRRLQGLREELGELLDGDDDGSDAPDAAKEPAPELTAREDLQQRLITAQRRRRGTRAKGGGRGAEPAAATEGEEEGDEPVA